MRSRRRAADPGRQIRNTHRAASRFRKASAQTFAAFADVIAVENHSPDAARPTVSIELRTFLPCLQGNRCLERRETSWPPGFGVLS